MVDNRLSKLERAKKLLLEIQQELGVSADDLKKILDQEIRIPSSVFNQELTVLESVVKYLKEERNMTLQQVALEVGRDQRNMWHIYRSASSKQSPKFRLKQSEVYVPLSIFLDKKLSAQESLVSFLRDEEHLSYNEIAAVLKRSASTIRTVYQRGRKKYAK